MSGTSLLSHIPMQDEPDWALGPKKTFYEKLANPALTSVVR